MSIRWAVARRHRRRARPLPRKGREPKDWEPMASPDDPTGEHGSLYAARKGVYPKKVDGPFRRFKWAIMAVTLAIYYGTPWIRWDRGPHAPDQAVLVDLANRRFYMFQIEIWPHEFYYVAGLLIMAGIGLFLVTSAVGRAWCGYACPQTVWTDLFPRSDERGVGKGCGSTVIIR